MKSSIDWYLNAGSSKLSGGKGPECCRAICSNRRLLSMRIKVAAQANTTTAAASHHSVVIRGNRIADLRYAQGDWMQIESMFSQAVPGAGTHLPPPGR